MRRVRTGAALAILAGGPNLVAAEDWVMAKTTNFVVVSDAGEKSARRVARQFEIFRELFRSVLNARAETTRPLVVLATRDESGMKELLPRHYRVKGGVHPAGIFMGGGDMHHIALRLDVEGAHPYQVVYHEYTHLLIRGSFPQVPLWLNEGLAEFYASAEIDETDVRFGQLFPRHVRLLRERTMLPVSKLLAIDASSPEYNESSRVGAFYAGAAVLTHYFVLGARGVHRADLINYLTLLGQGLTEADAQHRAFGDPKKLENAFYTYVHGFQFYGLKAPLRVEPPPATVGRLSEAEALAIRGQFLAHYGARSEALKLADRAIESDPGQALAHEVRGRVLATQGRRREALVELTRAAELAPRDFIVHYRLGVTALPHEDEAERSRRERSLRKAIELQPGYAPAHNALAALIQPKDAEEAVKHARTAGAIEPSETSHVLRLAGAQRAAGRVAEADTIELGLVRAAQGDSRLLTEITWYFRNEGRPADAEALLRRVRTARPDLVRATILLASMLAQEKKYDEAEALYREALRAQPEDPSLLNSLGYMNADRSLRVPEALELIEKALRKRPDEPSFLDSRGWAYFRLGRPAEAERDLRKAIGQGADAVMLDHLGDVLAARGAREEAIASWREALEQEDISDELRGSIEAKLAQAAQKPPETSTLSLTSRGKARTL